MNTYDVAVAMACHNRRETTLKCLGALSDQRGRFRLRIYLVDDGSTDGTARAVRREFPRVRLIRTNGSLYWNGAMHRALAEALKTPHDFHLWLNDDAVLYPDALARMVDTFEAERSRSGMPPVVVGAFCDPDTGKRSYGGLIRACPLHPLKFSRVGGEGHPVSCRTFEGNGVLVPSGVFRKIGIIDHRFSGAQAAGDTDYGLRAAACGFQIVTAPGFAGTCRPNGQGTPWAEPALSVSARRRSLSGPKGLCPKTYAILTCRHTGILWPVYWGLFMARSLFRFWRPG